MLDIIEITIEEFEKNIYDKYITLFPEDEQKEWEIVKKTYQKGIEHFYKIMLDDTEIGFFMLEKLPNKIWYGDYFGIYKEYQHNGYGRRAFKLLLDTIVSDTGLIGEIEKPVSTDPITIKRLEFYKQLGFREIGSEYLLYGVNYDAIICSNKEYSKEELDKIFFEYYLVNIGDIDKLNKNCMVIK